MLKEQNKEYIKMLMIHLKFVWALCQKLDGCLGVQQLRKDYCDTCNDIVGLLKKAGCTEDDISDVMGDAEYEQAEASYLKCINERYAEQFSEKEAA